MDLFDQTIDRMLLIQTWINGICSEMKSSQVDLEQWIKINQDIQPDSWETIEKLP